METLGSKQVYGNPWMTVREDAIRRLEGSTGIYAVVDSPDIALVIPSNGDRFHLVEQYRYPVAGRRREFPSGSADSRLDVDAAGLAACELRPSGPRITADISRLLVVSEGDLNQRHHTL